MRELVNEINDVFVNTKIIISLPTPRADKEALNNKAQMLNLLIKEEFHDERSVVLYDNSNLSYKGVLFGRPRAWSMQSLMLDASIAIPLCGR
jgi:hypothetical protein